MKLEFSQQNLKNSYISNFVKIYPVRAHLFMWTDGWTNRLKLIVAFCSFANALKKGVNLHYLISADIVKLEISVQ